MKIDWSNVLKWMLVYLINVVALLIGFYLGRAAFMGG